MSSDGDDMSFYDAPGGSDSGSEEYQFPSDNALTAGRVDDWSSHVREDDTQSTSPLSTPTLAKNALPLQDRSIEGLSTRSQNRSSLPEPVPAIPEHFLALGKRATVAVDTSARKESPKLTITLERPSTSGGEKKTTQGNGTIIKRAPQPTLTTRRKSLPSSPVQIHRDTLEKLESKTSLRRSADMSRLGRGRNEDLFLELANDQAGAEEGRRPPSRAERVSSRLSFSGKRRSLPAESALPSSEDRRPKTSGYVFGNRAHSRLDNPPSDLQRHMDRYRSTPSRASFQAEDAVSVSSRKSGRPHRYTMMPERSSSLLVDQARSPEMPHYGRRRPSFGATPSQPQKPRPSQLSNKVQDSYSESPADSSEPKQSLPDSATEESQPEDTVWDELDDLKSRIKKLELTGKMPQTSGAVVSGEVGERPRTATTAPTTIDSSPKHEKPEKPDQKAEPEPETEETAAENTVGGSPAANIHPLLHSALAKAKPLLSGTLYRSLEATAADALQLASMTGSAGPQGTAFSAAAIINGVTASDRHVRRKADTMCRNLTDLCLALCEGKHEASNIMSSPVTLDTPNNSSPSLRYSRSSMGQNDSVPRRAMSRLEARRTSILGSQAGSSLGNSPMESGEDMSASEQESTPSNLKVPESRRFGRAGSRLQTARMQRYDDASGDEDPTVRPLSRAMTDAGHAKQLSPREYNTPQQQRSPSLRESLAQRRVNAAAHEGNQELSRVPSMGSHSGGHRRFLDHSTPPVLEEESNGDDYQPVSQPKRRVTSLGQYGGRRPTADLPSRATSLHQRRHVIVE